MGLIKDKSYYFIRYGYETLSMCERRGKSCYQKGNVKGGIIIWEMQGKKFIRDIDSSSDEGQRILAEHGYQKVD